MSAITHDAPATRYRPDTASPPRSQRITSLDVVRGIIMVLMAIDHVRVYAGVPAGGPTYGVFFTRWVTHFSAPGFAFLAGTGAFLYAQRRSGGKKDVATYLVTRGLLLVAIELIVMRASWTFNADVAHYNLAGVLWMLGWCMVLMGGLVWLPTVAVGVIGLALIFGQMVFGPIGDTLGTIGAFLYVGSGGGVQVGGLPIDILYVIVPWIGVMAAGYGFGAIMTRDAASRKKICLWIGGVATGVFVIAATVLALRAQTRPNAPPLFYRILAQRKYPASALFLLMTLGPTIAFVPYADRLKGWLGQMLTTFGRVPLFFYILHIPLIHALALVVSLVREGSVNPWLFANHPVDPGPAPEGYRWSLLLLYAVWVVAIGLLYFPCRWYSDYKAKGTAAWTKYL